MFRSRLFLLLVTIFVVLITIVLGSGHDFGLRLRQAQVKQESLGCLFFCRSRSRSSRSQDKKDWPVPPMITPTKDCQRAETVGVSPPGRYGETSTRVFEERIYVGTGRQDTDEKEGCRLRTSN